MSKKIIIILLFCMAILSCKKKDNSTVTPPAVNDSTKINPQDTTAKQGSTYIIAGIRDVTFNTPNGYEEILMSLAGINGQQNRIDLSVEGLPTGVTASFDPNTGIMPYTTTLTLRNDFGKAGTYDVTLKGTNENGLTKKLTFRLTVPAYSCTEQLYYKYGFSLQVLKFDGSPYSSTGLVKNSATTMSFTHLPMETRGSGMGAYFVSVDNVDAIVDCDKKSITIPVKQYGAGGYAYTVSGGGTYDLAANKFNVGYTVVTPENTTLVYTINNP